MIIFKHNLGIIILIHVATALVINNYFVRHMSQALRKTPLSEKVVYEYFDT